MLRAAILAPSLVLAAACGASSHPAQHSPAPAVERSNITRADYAGSERCQPCHAAIYDRWSHSPMHRMTRLASAEIRAPFDPPYTFRFGDTEAVMSQRGDQRFVRLAIDGAPVAYYRITRVIGGRYREDFAAIKVASDSPDAPVLGDPRDEVIMPVSWVYSTQSWRYKGYSVQLPERPGMRAGPVWRQACIFCHNTTPFFSSTFDSLFGSGAPTYQGQLRNNLLPADRSWHFAVTDDTELRDALASEVEHLTHRSVDPAADNTQQLLSSAIRTTLGRFDASDLVEVGIGCESCHNGARDHAEHGSLPSFQIESPFLREEAAATSHARPSEAAWVNRTCARCHTVLFSHYPYTWEGGSRQGSSPGGSTINSGEARDFLLGGCASQMSCASCHDPHTQDSSADLARLATPAGNGLCLQCHAQYRGDEALRAHAHHDPAGAGAVCIDCHMPRKNMGLDYNLTRYHRIGSPNDPTRVERDRPLECALCHADRTVNQLVSTMERWWPRRFDRAALAQLYGGDLDVNVLRATLERGRPHEQAVAMGVLGREHAADALPLIVEQANNAYPIVRYFALHAAGSIVGQLPDWDMRATGTVLRRQARAWLHARDPSYVPPSESHAVPSGVGGEQAPPED